MAIPLKKFAQQCEKAAIANGRITPASSPAVSLYGISRQWRALCNATDFRDLELRDRSEKEKCAAEVIIAALTYLQRIGCNGMEGLLRDTLELQARQKNIGFVNGYSDNVINDDVK